MELQIDEARNIATIKMNGPLSSRVILNAFDVGVSHEKYKKGDLG
jgi:hypothetical protein